MKVLNSILIVLSPLFIKADNVRLSATPEKSNFAYEEIITLMDEEEGYYDNIMSNVMPNGNYIVMDIGNKTINVYDNKAELITSFGKEGNGPGEFNRPRFLFTAKDRIIVGEWRRTQIFDGKGKFINEVTGGRAEPVITKDGISFVTRGDSRQKNLITKYDFNGKMVKEIANPEYSKEAAEEGRRGWNADRFKEMMTRPRQLTQFPK